MIKYFIRIGELLFDRWGGDYIAYSTKSEKELMDDNDFLSEVHDALCDLYYEYGEEDETQEDFIDEGGIIEIRLYDESSDDTYEILHDER